MRIIATTLDYGVSAGRRCYEIWPTLRSALSRWRQTRTRREVEVSIDPEVGIATEYVDGLEKLGAGALPIIAGQVEHSRRQTEESIEGLTGRFAALAQEITAVIEETGGSSDASGAAIPSSFREAMERLEDVGQSQRHLQEKDERMLAQVYSLADRVSGLTKMSERVDDIARKIHLLAFNAAIEAASVGKNGAGFAVIADHVRSLASDSSETSREMQAEIDQAVQAMERVKESADHGMRQMAESNQRIAVTMEGLERSIGRLNDDKAKLQDVGTNIRSQINEVMVLLQFQDRTSQILGSAIQSMNRIEQEITSASASRKLPGAECVIDADSILNDMYESYTTGEQKVIHGNDAAQEDEASELTFF